jgi:hypothetical protein
MSGGTPGEIDLSLGAVLVGTEVVRLRGGGVGIALNCSLDSALRTQKWIVVLGLGGVRESPRIDSDQPDSHRDLRRDSASGRGRASIKRTSSLGSKVFSAIPLLYSSSTRSFRDRGLRILYGRSESMNLYVFLLLACETAPVVLATSKNRFQVVSMNSALLLFKINPHEAFMQQHMFIYVCIKLVENLE